MKLYRAVNSDSDAVSLQAEAAVCKVYSFSRKKHIIVHTYNINGKALSRCDSFRDLGVVFDGRMSFISHVDYIVNKARSVLGFLVRNCK